MHSCEVNKKRTFSLPKFEISIMVAGGISQYGLSNLVFCSGTMNKFSYKQFLLFLKKDMDNLKEKYSLNKDLIFQKDNASCHKSKETLEAIEVIFGENKIWWPANSPDLSPIETVWAILKQELSKKINSSLNELRERVLDIWCRFPVELCQKIVSEFDSKIRICQKEEGKIVSKALYKKYNKEEKKKNEEYDWTSIKIDKSFRIVYNNKIIESLIKKVIKRIKYTLKIQKINYKKDFPKAKKGEKFIGGITYRQKNDKRMKDLLELEKAYQNIVSYFKKITPLEFINNFLNRDLFNNKEYLINTRLSAEIEINNTVFKNIVLGIEKIEENKELTMDEEIENKINLAIKKSKISSLEKYMPWSININPFPLEFTKKDKNIEDDDSEETKYTYKDSCDLIEQLEENIKNFRKKNKDVQEKEKRIIIKNYKSEGDEENNEIYEGENDGENDEDENDGEIED